MHLTLFSMLAHDPNIEIAIFGDNNDNIALHEILELIGSSAMFAIGCIVVV